MVSPRQVRRSRSTLFHVVAVRAHCLTAVAWLGAAPALLVAPALAGTVNGYTVAAPVAASFCALTPAAATALTGCPVPAGSVCILATVTGANVNWRDDGTPTATVGSGGQQIPSGSTFWYCGALSAIKFIQQSATATMGVSFYK